MTMGLIEKEGNTPAEVVRRQYIASASADLEALRATLAPDVEWRLGGVGCARRPVRGRR